MSTNKQLRVGILGGMSHESTVDLYKLILQKSKVGHPDRPQPEIVIFSVNFEKIVALQEAEVFDKESYVRELCRGIAALNAAKVDHIVIASNTPHVVYSELQDCSSAPIRNIVIATKNRALKEKYRKLLLLGTKPTMSSSFYVDEFQKSDLDIIVPTVQEQGNIHRIIFNELVHGTIDANSRDYLLSVINACDADAVILGCTELSLLVSKKTTSIPLLDTLEIQAENALRPSN